MDAGNFIENLKLNRELLIARLEDLNRQCSDIEEQIQAINILMRHQNVDLKQESNDVNDKVGNNKLNNSDYPFNGSLAEKILFVISIKETFSNKNIMDYIREMENNRYDEQQLYSTVSTYVSRWMKSGSIKIHEVKGRYKTYMKTKTGQVSLPGF